MSKTKKYTKKKKQYFATLYKYIIYITWYKYLINMIICIKPLIHGQINLTHFLNQKL